MLLRFENQLRKDMGMIKIYKIIVETRAALS
jgi:hypothetical protein